MNDPVGSGQAGHGEPNDAPDGAPARSETGAPGARAAAPSGSADHRGLIVFLGVLALVLLLVGAVGAAGLPGGSGSDGAGPGAAPGSGHAYGQQKQAQKAERRAQREAERRQRKQDQLERKARRAELREQRHQSGMGPKIADELTEQTGTVATQTAADGTTVYVLQTAAGTLALDVGPPRYWGESHPLAPFVGQSVTVSGVQKGGSGEFAVFTIGDTVIRGPGRPPWAGGWKADGQKAPTIEASPSPSPSPTP